MRLKPEDPSSYRVPPLYGHDLEVLERLFQSRPVHSISHRAWWGMVGSGGVKGDHEGDMVGACQGDGDGVT